MLEVPEKMTSLRNNILGTIANSQAIFKSQQKDEPELTIEEKHKIASDLLDKSHVLFLSKFGKYLNTNLLEFFTEKTDNNNYELTHYIKKLKRYFDSKTRNIDIRNRRYEALKVLIEKNEYFSEVEMMRRNPLLYDNLIGKYLTEDDIKARDNLDTTNITFVNLLMEKIDRDGIKKLRKNQKDAEDEVYEEFDSDSESENDDDDDDEEEKKDKWGEMHGSVEGWENDKKDENKKPKVININHEEQKILKQEFITYMYQSFLDGKDKDFDYSTVDDNDAYDNVNLRDQDEQEKYFDSESPDVMTPMDNQNSQQLDDESEDELDKYMKSLKVN